ncbi:ATP-binding protein [uncultured Adlercreutzia sp.]|uniref:ATP-binding protein n=1 Tax=uncultured Adlercreutzia sp. TaxID=875803 RepID=UPI0026F3B744|nr:ATP-binding protein [uncultured Adlercreutzia sp.]
MDIAQEFEVEGNEGLADFVMALVADANTFVPQSLGGGSEYLVPVSLAIGSEGAADLQLPSEVESSIQSIVSVASDGMGINKFLFYGAPGTGKTEAVKLIARETGRELYWVDMTQMVDSYLGQTAKNIDLVFKEINHAVHPERMIVLFDEIDAIALTRIDSNDVREMGRATTALLRGLDSLTSNVLLFATTNLYESVDKALLRRFDLSVSFDEYERADLEKVAVLFLERFLKLKPAATSDKPLFRKILKLYPALPAPGDLQNVIKVAVAFSDSGNRFDYLRRVYRSATGRDPDDIVRLRDEGFTVREIERLTSVSKSTVSRKTARRGEGGINV